MLYVVFGAGHVRCFECRRQEHDRTFRAWSLVSECIGDFQNSSYANRIARYLGVVIAYVVDLCVEVIPMGGVNHCFISLLAAW